MLVVCEEHSSEFAPPFIEEPMVAAVGGDVAQGRAAHAIIKMVSGLLRPPGAFVLRYSLVHDLQLFL